MSKTWLAKQSRAAITRANIRSHYSHPHLVSQATRRGNSETGARPPIEPLNRPTTFLSEPTAQAASNPSTPSTGGGMSRAAGGTGARVRRCGPEPISAGQMRKRLALASLAVCWGDDPWCKVCLVRGKYSVRRESPGCIAHADARHLKMLRRGLFARCDAVRPRTQPQPLAANPARLLASRGRGRRDLARIYCTWQALASTKAPATRVSKVRSRQ